MYNFSILSLIMCINTFVVSVKINRMTALFQLLPSDTRDNAAIATLFRLLESDRNSVVRTAKLYTSLCNDRNNVAITTSSLSLKSE